MTKILIVDDNKNNRMTLQFLLEDFEDENQDVQLELFEAENGKEAVKMCKEKSFDIIFMDIMMPIMDGIEATKLIRAIIYPKNILIIACSALSDNEHKNKILSAGAEDYITKPIDDKVFTKRISNYLNLIKNRNKRAYNIDAENILTNNIYFRKIVFMIKNETALSEFWEFCLLENNYADSEKFADLMRLVYGLGVYQIRQKFNFNIYLEENDESLFFTMDNIILLKATIVENLIQKNCPDANYKIVGNKVTFCFAKNGSKNVVEADDAVEEEPIVVLKNIEVVKESEIELQIFSFMDQVDIYELEEIAGELRSLFTLIGTSNMTKNEIFQIADFIQKFAAILFAYNETFAMSAALKTLSSDIIENFITFQQKAKDIGSLCEAFNRDLILWIKKLFFEGAPSIDFLDSSIISNANMISSFIKPVAVKEEAVLDDIFDF